MCGDCGLKLLQTEDTRGYLRSNLFRIGASVLLID